MPTSVPGETFRFNDFELDVVAYQLRRQGRVIRLERQPMDVLILLVERRRQLVSRADIVERLWGKDVFVDVETGVHTAIRKIRQALGDSISTPAFVETIPSKGYRFVADVEVVSPGSDSRLATAQVEPSPTQGRQQPNGIRTGTLDDHDSTLTAAGRAAPALGSEITRATQPRRANPARLLIAFVTLATVAGFVAWTRFPWGAPAAPITVAVLPFEYLGTDAEREYLAAGLTEETSASLAQIDLERLIVKGRTLAYRGTPKAAAQIGQELSVDYLVEGSIRSEGGRLRVTATLIRVQDQQHVCVWASLASTLAASTLNGDARPLDVWPRARDAADRAVRGNASLGEAQIAVGSLNWLLDWDWGAAETAFRLAISLDPSNAAAHGSLGHALSQSGQRTEAESAMRRTRELEPLEPLTYALSAQVAFQAREYAAAIAHARRAILIDSEFWIGYMQLGQAYERTGQADLALAALTDAARFSGSNSKATSLRGYVLAKTGRTNEAREVLRRLESDSRERYVPPVAMALVHAGLGEGEAVMEWLAKAYDARDVHLIYLPVDPKWDPYRADPRFKALVTRCGFTASTRGGPLSTLLPSAARRR